MKKYRLPLFIAFILISTINYGQQKEQIQIEKLMEFLNTSIAPKFQLELKRNKGNFRTDKFYATLDLRNSFEIAEDSILKNTKQKPKEFKPYIGPIFWKYNFEKAVSAEVTFKPNKYKQLFCTILFNVQDTIVLKSGLNAYTSYHRTSDAALHYVNWTGDKYISLLLTPKKVDSKIKFELKGITISGKFERSDKNDIAKNYSKSLSTIFKREFKNLFESEEMSLLITNKE